MPTSREQIQAEWDVGAYRAAFPEVPVVLIDAWVMPYPLGFDLARRYAQEGWRSEQQDALLRDPPLSSEQLLHPEKWLDPELLDLPVFVELPKLESGTCTEYGRNTSGAIGWRRFLEQRSAAEIPAQPEEVAEAVRGWGGDQYAMFDCAGLEHVAVAYVGDSAADADEFAAAVMASLRAISERSVELASEINVRTEGARVQATLGFSAALLEQLWQGTTFTRFENLDAFLEAHPEVLEHAAALRASALRSGQEDNAGG